MSFINSIFASPSFLISSFFFSIVSLGISAASYKLGTGLSYDISTKPYLNLNITSIFDLLFSSIFYKL